MPFAKPKPLARDELKTYALRLLGARALSVAELKERLRRRAAVLADVEDIIVSLKDLGLLSDTRFADSYAATRRDSRGFGSQRVLSDLLKKKVAPSIAERAVGHAYADTDETALIEEFLARKFRGQKLGEMLRQPPRLASVYRRLRQAGFASGPSIRVLKRYAAEAEQLEGLEEPPEEN